MSTQVIEKPKKEGLPTIYWMFAGLVFLLFVLVILRIVNSTMLVIVFIFGVGSILFIDEAKKKVPDAFIFRHPDNGGGYDLAQRPHLQHQRSHPFPFKWWGLKKVPLYFWWERKVETPQAIEDLRPTVPMDIEQHKCVCGFSSDGKFADRLFSSHVTWNPKKTSQSQDDFNRQHHQVTAADIKGAAVAVATAVQDKPVLKIEYLIEPYEPEPDLDKSPNALWDETNWTQDLLDFYGEDNGLAEKVKIGTAVVLVGILAVLVFLIIGAK